LRLRLAVERERDVTEVPAGYRSQGPILLAGPKGLKLT
jgi:hypothetical protein